MKICIAGGHVTPAIALISELKSRGHNEIIFIGRQRAMEGDRTPSIESALIPQLGVKFFAINPGRLQRSFTRYTIPALLRTPLAFFQALLLLLREYPNVVVSFGSYVALPVVVAAWILRIPIVTHEQTVVSGLSNRLISRLANRIAVSYEESLSNFPRHKTVLTGNPVRPEVLEDRSQKFNFQTKLPVLYVTAGNQGSHVINEAVQQILPNLLERYILIHQVGAAGFYDDYGTLGETAEKLPTRLQERYHLERYIGPQDIGSVLRRADLVIGRSGANTVSDLAATKVPALFIPLPFATHDEQTKNARLLVNAGSAEILPQRELTPERLLAVTEMMIENLRRYKKAATEAKQLVRPDAAKRLASEVIAIAR